MDGVLDELRRVICTSSGSLAIVVEFAEKLAAIYNATSKLDTGTVLHVTSPDGGVLIVCLQSVYAGSNARA